MNELSMNHHSKKDLPPAEAPDAVCIPLARLNESPAADKQALDEAIDGDVPPPSSGSSAPPPAGVAQDAPDDPNAKVAEDSDKSVVDAIEEEFGAYFYVDGKTIRHNPTAIARKLTRDLTLVFDEPSKSFWQYNAQEGFWLPMEPQALRGQVTKLMHNLAKENDVENFFYKLSHTCINGLLESAKPCTQLGPPPRPQAQLVAAGNGCLDLSGEKPKLSPLTPDHWFTSKVTVPWDPAAKCNRWTNELLKPALAHQEDLALLQKILGSMLVSGNPYQGILMLTGIGGSGKSTVVSVFERIMGPTRVAHLRTAHVNGRFETHFYQGSDILVAKDVPQNFLEKGGDSLKWLTGGDWFQSEQKYGGKAAMKGTFNVIVTANQRPLVKVAGDAEAWTRRLIPISFTGTPDKIIPSLADDLVTQEGPGILAWLVEGYRLSRSGLGLSEDQKQRREEYVNESQSVRVFVRDRIELAKRKAVTVEEAVAAYHMHCKERRWTPVPVQRFQTDLRILMQEIHNVPRSNDILRKSKPLRGYHGVEIRPTAP